MLLIQELLQSGKTPDQISQDHGLEFKFYGHKFSVNYDQIETNNSDPVSQQCRGLVLTTNNYQILACPMFRFFNYGQEAMADVDWSRVEIQEKVDGTLCIVYWDFITETWCLATRKCAEATLPINGYEDNFTTLFDKGIKEILGQDFQSWAKNTLSRGYTYCFELCSPINRILVKYDKIEIYLLSVRNNLTLKEESTQSWSEIIGIPPVKTYPFSTLDNLISMVRDWDPTQHEGVIAFDPVTFARIKIKNPQHTAYNTLRDLFETSPRTIVEAILLNKDDDILPFMAPMIQEKVLSLKEKIIAVFKDLEKIWEEVKDIDNMKEFALTLQKKHHYPHPLFSLKRGNTSSIKEYFMTPAPNGINIATSKLDSLLDLCK